MRKRGWYVSTLQQPETQDVVKNFDWFKTSSMQRCSLMPLQSVAYNIR